MRRASHRFGILLSLSSALLTLVGCGAQEPSETAGSDDSEGLLLVLLGGNASCIEDADGQPSPEWMDMQGPFRDLAKHASDNQGRGPRRVSMLSTCHQLDSLLHWTTSDRHDDPSIADLQRTGEIIESFRVSTQSRHVILIGHSYGGWLAMKLASAAEIMGLEGLFTIDPISRVHCSVSRPLGCTAAPQDFDSDARDRIAQVSGRWINFWQNRTLYLHSSIIPEANANQQIDAGHTAIDNHAAVWSTITKQYDSL